MSFFCLYPHAALTIEAFGEVRVCTSSMEPLFDLNHDEVSLKGILNTNLYNQITSSFESKQFPKTCRSCEKVEKTGVPSKRILFNRKREEKWGKSKIDEILTSEVKKPLHLSVGFSNRCNLQCAMCSSKYSTKWMEDEANALEKGFDTRSLYNDFHLSEFNQNELIEIASEASDIFIKGGEPFFNQEVFVFLEAIKSRSERPHIFIQSNGTFVNKGIMKLVEELNIEMGISIDGTFDTYEWIRGFPYSQIRENIEAFAALKTDYPLSLDYTSSIYNVMDIKRTYEELGDLVSGNDGVSHLSLVSIARQVESDLRNLPLAMREPLALLPNLNDFKAESSDVFLKTLKMQELDHASQRYSKRWIKLLEEKRGSIPSRKNRDFDNWLRGEV